MGSQLLTTITSIRSTFIYRRMAFDTKLLFILSITMLPVSMGQIIGMTPNLTIPETSEIPSNFTYIMIDSGSCDSNGYEMLGSKIECEQAASDLGLLDTSAYESQTNGRPYGCIYVD